MYKCRSTDIDDRNSAASQMDKILSQKIDNEFTEAIKVLRNSQGADPVQAERAEDKGDCSCPPATDWKTG